MYFAGFYLPLNPPATTVYARSAFYPSPAFYSQSVVCILPLVRSPQSSSYTDRVANHDVLSEAHFMPDFFLSARFCYLF